VPVAASGSNLTSRWRHVLSKDADIQLQFYYDRTRRDFGNGFQENLGTYDLDWQHRFVLGAHQELVWGLGLRWMDDQVDNLPLFAFLPGHKVLHLYSAFVQDEIRMFDDRWRLALGSKFERNDYTGVEYQPSGRLAWTPTAQQTLWAAVSRAVRTPSRIDRDFFLSLTPTFPFIAGGDFQSETVLAYELGWRAQPRPGVSLSLSTFFNDYDDLRSAEPGPPPLGIPITFGNGVKGQSYGIEWAATYALTEDWRLRGGYTFLKKHLAIKTGSHDLNQATSESDDPENQVVLQSILTLAHAVQLDAVLRYVDALPNPRVASYVGLDLRLAWTVMNHLEIAVVGQNLLDARHPEFVPSSPSPREIERSFYGKLTWRQ
jgi:iron complex outermembrane receptor protein